MTSYVLRRVGLALLTLFLLSIIIFFAGEVLPGNPGRAILGPFAAESAVKALDQQLGVNRPILTQYWTWLTGILHGDLGTSYQFRAPVSTFLWPALGRSLKLAAVAFVIVVPVSIVGGVLAALYRGRLVDRSISVAGLSLSTVPEFVSGIVLIVVFAIGLKWLPVSANAPAGSSPLTQLRYLIGGLVVVETLFNYPGLGRLIFTAVTDKDFPMLEAGVLVIGVVYLLATLVADILYTVLNPRIRLQGAE